MPERIARLISNEDDPEAKGTSNTAEGIISNLALVLDHDRDVESAVLCNALVPHIHRISGEGHHFCGYRNMQMLCLAIGRSGYSSKDSDSSEALELLRHKLSIPRLQQLIEQAWDKGINAHARVQTGGIIGTRKDVGTSEAEALLLNFNIPCTGHSFSNSKALFDFVETYFKPTASQPPPTTTKTITEKPRITITTLPPIFLQRPHHSMTIVGIERTRSGNRRLLTFDPAYLPPSSMLAPLRETQCSGWWARAMLWRYRKAESSLRRFSAFEALTVDSSKMG